MTDESAVDVCGVSHRYGDTTALDQLSLTIHRGEVFAFLGPNGGGKTTLFRLLSTLVPLQAGHVGILGFDLRTRVHEIRCRLGVAFQAPSLDKKLTVRENIRCQAALYGLSGESLRRREEQVLSSFGLKDRADQRCETLSGGLRRRCELAKSLIHTPPLLLLDEPSTGLDPGARLDLWAALQRLRDASQTTVVLTTHLLEEAEKADRIAILDRGRLVALGPPETLRAELGGETVWLETPAPRELAAALRERFQLESREVDGTLRLEHPEARQWVVRLLEAFPGQIRAITLARPTLEDVFIQRTGHRFGRVTP